MCANASELVLRITLMMVDGEPCSPDRKSDWLALTFSHALQKQLEPMRAVEFVRCHGTYMANGEDIRGTLTLVVKGRMDDFGQVFSLDQPHSAHDPGINATIVFLVDTETMRVAGEMRTKRNSE